MAEIVVREKAKHETEEKITRKKVERAIVEENAPVKTEQELEKRPFMEDKESAARQKSHENPSAEATKSQQINYASGKSQKNIFTIVGVFVLVCVGVVCSGIIFPRLIQYQSNRPTEFPTNDFFVPYFFTPIISSETPLPIIPTETIHPTVTPLPSAIADWLGIKMILIPAGEFIMEDDNDNATDNPAHTVYLDSYYIDEYEVTNSLYKECVHKEVCKVPAVPSFDDNYYNDSKYDNYPMLNVDWDMANTYCSFRMARLPTEAEWEKAARGTDGRIYPWGDKVDATLANLNSQFPAPIGSYLYDISPYGIYDMAGNASEWVSDWYDVYPNGDPNAAIDFGQTWKVIRGGAWITDLLSNSFRLHLPPSGNPLNSLVGIRCAFTP